MVIEPEKNLHLSAVLYAKLFLCEIICDSLFKRGIVDPVTLYNSIGLTPVRPSVVYSLLLIYNLVLPQHHLRYCVKDACFRTPRAEAVYRTLRELCFCWLIDDCFSLFVRTNSSFHTWLFLVASVPTVGTVLSSCARIAAVLTISSFINRLLLVITKSFTMNWFITYR